MEGKIYKITNNINDKVYIGKTYNTLKQRFNEHISESKREKSKNRPLYRAINKYGIENFSIELIGEYEQGLLEEMEIEFIAEYDSYKNGYNATLGGDGKRYFEYSDKAIIKKYLELKRIYKTAEYFNCDEKTIRRILKSNNIEIFFASKRNKFTDKEAIEKYKELGYINKTAEYFKCSDGSISKILHKNNIKILDTVRYDEESIIKKYQEIKNIKEIAECFDCCTATIRKILNKNGIKLGKPCVIRTIAKLDKDTLEILNIYPSASNAGESLGSRTKGTHILKVCKGERVTAYGYKWKFIE